MTTNGTPPNSPASWWRSGPALLSLMISTALASALGWLTGINNRLDIHNQRIQTLEVQGQQQGKQLDRIEQAGRTVGTPPLTRFSNPTPQPPPRSGEGEKDGDSSFRLPLSASGRGLGGGVVTYGDRAMKTPRNRIKRHVAIRAGDLVPHELNPRLHGAVQRAALEALYEEIGFARSLLAYELSDGRLKLIDGHLRAVLDPEQVVEVEVLDVSDAEARALLLAIDPLAQLADYEATTLCELRALAGPDSAAVRQLWDAIEAAGASVTETLEKARARRRRTCCRSSFWC